MSFLLKIVLSVLLHGLAAAAGSASPCGIDLTARGLPACAQQCPEWCWATVVGELKEYYRAIAPGPGLHKKLGATPACRRSECRIVSDVRKQACCKDSTECAASGTTTPGCGNPSSPEEIMLAFQHEIPSLQWVHLHGKPGYSCKPGDGCWPAESTLQRLLMSGTPVARATHGHITTIAGCRQGPSNTTEYRILDSLKNPDVALWMNWTILTLGPPPGQGDGPWQDTYFANVNGTSAVLL